MKPFERLHAAVNFEEHDRPPFTDQEWLDVGTVPHFSGYIPRKDRRYSEVDRARAIRTSMDAIPYGYIYGTRYPVLGEIPEIKDGDRFVQDGFHCIFRGFSASVEARPFSDVNGFARYLEKKIDEVQNTSPQLPSDFKEKLEYAKKMMGDTIIGYSFVPLYLDQLYRLGWDILGPAIIEKPGLIAK